MFLTKCLGVLTRAWWSSTGFILVAFLSVSYTLFSDSLFVHSVVFSCHYKLQDNVFLTSTCLCACVLCVVTLVWSLSFHVLLYFAMTTVSLPHSHVMTLSAHHVALCVCLTRFNLRALTKYVLWRVYRIC